MSNTTVATASIDNKQHRKKNGRTHNGSGAHLFQRLLRSLGLRVLACLRTHRQSHNGITGAVHVKQPDDPNNELTQSRVLR